MPLGLPTFYNVETPRDKNPFGDFDLVSFFQSKAR